jgi:acetyl-CoA carboxylase carboxyl transferase subunit alpha
VISPEGCASILWRDPSKSLEAAEAMKLTAEELLKLGVIDEVIKEPLGGAHRNSNEIASAIKKSILKNLKSFDGLSGQDIFDQRKMKFLKIGRDRGFKKSFDMLGKGLSYVEPNFSKALRFIQSRKNILITILIMLMLIVIFNVLM